MRRVVSVALLAGALLGTVSAVGVIGIAAAEEAAKPNAEHRYVVGVSGMT